MSNYILYFEIIIYPRKKCPTNTIKYFKFTYICLFYGSLKALYFFSKLVSYASHESQKLCVQETHFYSQRNALHFYTVSGFIPWCTSRCKTVNYETNWSAHHVQCNFLLITRKGSRLENRIKCILGSSKADHARLTQ